MSKKNKQSRVNEISAIEIKEQTIARVAEEENNTDNIAVVEAVADLSVVEETMDTPVIEDVKEEKEEKEEVAEVKASKEVKTSKKEANQNKPTNKKSNGQGVIVESGIASVVVVDLNGNYFRLFGVKGNVGDTVEF